MGGGLWGVRSAQKTHKAAFFGFLLPGDPKVPLQHPPVAQRIDGALLMARHLLASARSLKTFSYVEQTRGLESVSLSAAIHYLVAHICVC